MSLPAPSSTIDPVMLKEMEGPLMELAHRSGGDLRKLLYAFFSFLHRRTDFYCIPHDDDAGKQHRLGFQDGDAEKLLLAAFRQFPLRKLPKQTTTPAGSAIRMQTKSEHPTTRDPPGHAGGDLSSSASMNTLTTPPGTLQTKGSKVKLKAEEGEKEVIEEDPMASTRYTDEGKQYPVGNGGSTKKYRWTQTLDEVTAIIAPPQGTRGKDLNVAIKSGSITVKLKTTSHPKNDGGAGYDNSDELCTILEGNLTDKIKPDESTWSIEGGVLLLTLQKVRKTWWECVMVGDPPIDTSLVDSRRRIDEYDDSTQGAIRRILFDQRQQRLGKPTSDQILRAQGINPIPPLPAGVEFIDKDTLDRAEQNQRWEPSNS